ncbi:MAG: ABA4-like family protein [Sphingopyxis sp.]
MAMQWDMVFTAVTLWAIMGWLLLLLAPRKPLALTAILYLGIALLCLAYTILLALLVLGRVGGGLPGGADFTSITGVQALFAVPAGAVLGWVHYLAFDLFVGLWIARDADAKGIGRLVQLPALLLSFLVGPVGLLLWLAMREKSARAQARRNAVTEALR